MANPRILLGGVEFDVDYGSLSLSGRIAERTTCSFVAWDLEGDLGVVSEGTPCQVYNPAGTVVFDGFVVVAEVIRPNPDDTPRRWQVDATDFHYLADKRSVADAWYTTDAGVIVQAMITDVLADEGVSAGTIDAGPELTEVVFAYIPVSQAMDRICAVTGYTWWIDTSKQLHYTPKTGAASVTVDAADCKAAPVLRRASPEYRNRQTVRGAKGYTDSQVESFKGDGSMTTFTVGYPIGLVPTVKVNAAAKTVGIRGLDSGKDWYWSKADATISQDTTGTVLTSSDVLEVTYQGLYPLVAISNDIAEQVRRAAVEQVGSGIVDAVVNVTEMFGSDAALDAAGGLLGTYAQEGRVLTFVTADTAYQAGQYADVQLPEVGLDGEEFLITAVESRDWTRQEWEFTVTAIQGADMGSWQKRLAVGLQTPDILTLRENISEQESLLTLAQYAEAWAWAAADVETVWQCPVTSTTLYPTTTLYPC